MEQIPIAFIELCNLLERRGHKNLSKHDGMLSMCIDEKWSVMFNPHNEPNKQNGVTYQPYTAHISYNEFPVGLIGPAGVAIIAGNDGSAEDDFINALKAA